MMIQWDSQGPKALGRGLGRSPKRRAFTLIEVLIAVALTGLVASLALAPVVYAVRRIVETEVAYSEESALRGTAAFMAKDVASGLRLAPVVLRVVDDEELGGGDNDTLIVAASSPAKQNLAAGSVVYKILRRSFVGEIIPGLYRWVVPGTLPENLKNEQTEDEDGLLVVPYVTGLDVEVFQGEEWVPEYDGGLPRGIRLTLSRGEERVEYVFAFPQ